VGNRKITRHARKGTDINLLFDAMRKTIILTARICQQEGISGWKLSNHLITLLSKIRFIN